VLRSASCLRIRASTIVSVITKTAAQNLALKEGKEVYAIIKATNVILGLD
jgi:molybdopterin-binding protein